MGFLNATLLAGLAATAIPVALHLITRREPKRVVFPAVRFLTQRFESNRSRMRIRRWWLLLLRIAALAALCLALANPIVHHSLSTQWITLGLVALLGVGLLAMASVAFIRFGGAVISYGLLAAAAALLLAVVLWGGYTVASGPTVEPESNVPVALAIVLDNGPTSAWNTADDDRLSRMRDVASWMITRVPNTSRIAVVDRSSVPVAFSLDAAGALSKIEGVETLQAPQPIAGRIEAAVRLLRTSELESRQVMVVSNLAQSSWSQQSFGDAFSASLKQDKPVSVVVFDLGDFDGTNRALRLQQITDRTPPRGIPVPLVTSVSLSAGTTVGPLSVTVELQRYESTPGLPVVRDGTTARPPLERVDRTSLKLVPGVASEVVLTMPPLDAGTHHGIIRLAGRDAFPLDDRRYFTLEVLPPSPLLLVADDVDEAKVLGAAITAPFAVDDPNAEYAIERIAYTDLPAVDPANFEATILLNPPAPVLRDSVLQSYVRDGGRLLITLGPAAGDVSVESELLPTLLRPWRIPQPGSFLEVIRENHPLFEPYIESPRWSDYPIFQYWHLEVDSERDRVLARIASTGHPAIVQGTVGDGTVLVVATPLPGVAASTRAWNDLFGAEAWPAFLLVRQAVEWLSERSANDRLALVGNPHVVALRPVEPEGAELNAEPQASGNAGSAAGPEDVAETRRLQLFPPGDNPPVPIETESKSSRVAITTVPQAGTYWLRGVSLREGFSANLPESATELARIDADQLDLIFGPEGYSLATDREQVELLEAESGANISMRSPALLLALIVFLLEQILGNRFYRSRLVGPSPTGAVTA